MPDWSEQLDEAPKDKPIDLKVMMKTGKEFIGKGWIWDDRRGVWRDPKEPVFVSGVAVTAWRER